jgi:cytochrome c biogenesis protein CcmG, thiol:disulfide interchange protein DsbE
MKFPLLLTFVFCCCNAFGADLAVGKPAPDIQARILGNAETFQLSQKKGKTIIVNFWATWCGPCKAEMPALQAYLERHKAEGLEVLAISMDNPRDEPAVRKIAQQYSFQVALSSDTQAKGLGRIWRMPTTFVIDRHPAQKRTSGRCGSHS